MAVGTGGQGGRLVPPLFRDVEKKFNGENAHEWCKWGVKFEFFWKIFRLASLAFLIIKQQFKNQYNFTKKMFNCMNVLLTILIYIN